MPIYEYICEKCHKKEEIIQRFGEEAPEVCPACSARGSLKKTVTTGSFHLKGGGWYKDGYASTKKPDATKSDSSTKETATPKTATKPKKDGE
jgi:putative FmdB family regulatory protein